MNRAGSAGSSRSDRLRVHSLAVSTASIPPTGRGNAAKPVNIDLDFEDAVKALLSVDPDDLPERATSPSQPDRSQSAPGS